MYSTSSQYEPIRDGRYIDATTDLNELVTSIDSSGGDMRMVLKRLLMETKRTLSRYQIIHIKRPTPHDRRYAHHVKFEITVQLTHQVPRREMDYDVVDFAFTLDQDYPFHPPRRMLVNGVAVSHEKYAALQWMGEVPPPRTPQHPTPMPNLHARSHHLLCDEVKQELSKIHSDRCFFCQLYNSGNWSPAKFLGTLVDEYLAVRADVVGAICKGVGRAKLMRYRVVLPDVLVDEILSWI